MAVLLTIITYFSSPILTAIFGDGSLEVRGHTPETQKKFFKPILSQGEDTEDWAYDEPVEMEVKAPATNSLNSEFYTPGGEQL